MTIPAATPHLPDIHVEHGPGALVVTLQDDRGRSLGTALSPRGARQLADELRWQADEADRLVAAYHPPDVPNSNRPHLIVLAVLVLLVVRGLVVGAVAAWG